MTTIYNRNGILCAVIGAVPKEPNEKDFSGDQWKESNAHKEYQQALQACKDSAVPFSDQIEIGVRLLIYNGISYGETKENVLRTVDRYLKTDTFHQVDCEVEIGHVCQYKQVDGNCDDCFKGNLCKNVARIKATPLESKNPDKEHFDKQLLKELVWKLDREVWAHVQNPSPSEEWSTSKAREETRNLISEYIGDYDKLSESLKEGQKELMEELWNTLVTEGIESALKKYKVARK